MISLRKIASNFTLVEFNELSVYFSYETPIAYHANNGRGVTVRENEWGPTTGKHLNYIDQGTSDAKRQRVAGKVFLDSLTDYMTSP